MKEHKVLLQQLLRRLGLLYLTHQQIQREDINMWQAFTNFLPWLFIHVQRQQQFLATKSMPAVFHTPHLPQSAACNVF